MLVADVPRATAEKPGRRLCRYAMALLGLSQKELKKKRDFTLKGKKTPKKKNSLRCYSWLRSWGHFYFHLLLVGSVLLQVAG